MEAPPSDSFGKNSNRRPERTEERLCPVVPDHEILRLIGTGAYGEVWLARSLTSAYRAVKVVWREDYEDEVTYVREFEGILHYEPVARKIPGVVHILHVGQGVVANREYYYYVMELADDAYTGIHIEPESYVPRTLQSDMELYGHNPMPLDYVLEVGSQLAHTLDGMRCEQLVHRDVKPSNIVFVNGRAKLADAGSVALSDNTSFVGTEGYMPPEGPGTPRADVYALAKVLYEMSTGKDRLEFPSLPDDVVEGDSRKRWLEFNEIICAAAEPRIQKNTIISARVLAEKLDALRQYAPSHQTMLGGRHSRRKIVIFALILLFAASVGGGLSISSPLREGLIQAVRARFSGTDATRNQEERDSLIFISTVPAGASIYTSDGTYVEETPYGPVEVRPRTELSFILRKEGYADKKISATAPEHGLLALGGDLQPYRPPRRGKDWQDALGSTYRASSGEHRALSPVTVQQFETFLRHSPSVSDLPYSAAGEYVRTTPAGINAYILWLARMCEAQGLLGYDHTLVALPEPGTARDGTCAYRLVTRPVQKTPISLHTTPSGATVWLNGRPIGVTPLQGVRVPLAPYFIEFKKPGYATARYSGISPQNLVISASLRANNSVAFGTEWVNSLGLAFRPLSPTLLAGVTEVRMADYHAFVATTGAPMPAPTDFAQEAHHPVVGVSRADAEHFARWLTAQERESGIIGPTDEYRLPTDEEWSFLAGIKEEKGATPYERGQRARSSLLPHFSWGTQWPPPPGTGNFSDTSALPYVSPQYTIEHYSDQFPFLAPVGSFAPNAQGIHDLIGNVQEWVSDEYGGPAGFAFRHYGVTRGGDYTSFRPAQLSTGIRTPRPADYRSPTVGFRLILERTQRAF